MSWRSAWATGETLFQRQTRAWGKKETGEEEESRMEGIFMGEGESSDHNTNLSRKYLFIM